MSSDYYYKNWGGWYECAWCGKKKYLTNPGDYVYKKPATTKGGSSLIYFCGWNHMRSWEKENEPKTRRIYDYVDGEY